MYKRNYLLKMNITEKIFAIRSCIDCGKRYQNLHNDMIRTVACQLQPADPNLSTQFWSMWHWHTDAATHSPTSTLSSHHFHGKLESKDGVDQNGSQW